MLNYDVSRNSIDKHLRIGEYDKRSKITVERSDGKEFSFSNWCGTSMDAETTAGQGGRSLKKSTRTEYDVIKTS